MPDTLIDGRAVPPCLVVFSCPECLAEITRNAYLGAVLHNNCSKFMEGKLPFAPLMRPIGLGEAVD